MEHEYDAEPHSTWAILGDWEMDEVDVHWLAEADCHDSEQRTRLCIDDPDRRRGTGPGSLAAVADPVQGLSTGILYGAVPGGLCELAPVVPYVVSSWQASKVQRAGCGFVLFLSSIIPLGLAFILRVRADLRAGMTWSDLFPPLQ